MDFAIVIITSLFFGIAIFFGRNSMEVDPLTAWIAISGGMLFFWVMSNFKTDKNVTAEYVNDKLESFTSALFDTLSETEERLRNLEQKYYELKNGQSKE